MSAKGGDRSGANDVSIPEAGCAHDTNAVVILDAKGGAQDVPLADKREVARLVLDAALTVHGTNRFLNGDST